MVEHYEFGRLMAAEMMDKEANSLVKGLFNNARRGVQAAKKFKPQMAMKAVGQAAPAAAEAAESAAKSAPSMMQTARRTGAKAMGRTKSVARAGAETVGDAASKGYANLPAGVKRTVAKGMGRAQTAGRAGAEMASQAGSDIARGARVARDAAGRAMGPTARKIVKNPAVQAGAGGAAAGLAAGGMLGGSGGPPPSPQAVAGPPSGPPAGSVGLAGLADQLKSMNPTARNALLGGGAGALAGGLYGLVNPGEDSKGRQKSRLMSALQNAALMGGVGAGVGGGAGYAGYGM